MIVRDEISVGDYLVNNDPRKPGQKVRVEALAKIGDDWYAIYRAGVRSARVRLDRVYKIGVKAPANSWTVAGSTV